MPSLTRTQLFCTVKWQKMTDVQVFNLNWRSVISDLRWREVEIYTYSADVQWWRQTWQGWWRIHSPPLPRWRSWHQWGVDKPLALSSGENLGPIEYATLSCQLQKARKTDDEILFGGRSWLWERETITGSSSNDLVKRPLINPDHPLHGRTEEPLSWACFLGA